MFRIIFVIFIGLMLVQVIRADDFTVSTPQELIDAINAANTDPDLDTITLTQNIVLTVVNNIHVSGPNGLPIITTPIVIDGAGFNVRRDSDLATPEFRIFYVESTGNLTLNHIFLQDGRAVNGGIIFNHQGHITVANGSGLHGQVTGAGGGIYNDLGTVNISETNFSGFAAEGGGIYNAGGTLSLESAFTFGIVTIAGAGIYNDAGVVDIATSVNFAVTNSTGIGGGLYNDGGFVTINRSLFVANVGGAGGGGVYNQSGQVTILNSTFSDQVTLGGDGASLYNQTDAMMTVMYSTFVVGGGFEPSNIYNDGTLDISYSIIQINDDKSEACKGSGTFNIVGNLAADTCGTVEVTNIENTPSDHGGPTSTHELLPGSNAINAGDDCSSTAGIDGIDQRGFARDELCDVGAYEFEGIEPTPTITPTFTLTRTPTATLVSTLTPTPVIETATPTAEVTITPTEITGIELIQNGGFEIDANADDIPDMWTQSNPTKDKRKCNKPGKEIAFEGECVYRFKSSADENSKLAQVLDASSVNIADTLVLNGQVNAKGEVNARVKVIVKYETLPKDKIKIKLTSETGGYTPLTGSVKTTAEIASLKVTLKNNGTSGKVLLDALSLQVDPALDARLIPLP